MEQMLTKRLQAIAAALREARERRGWSMRQTAKAAQVSVSTVARLENPGEGGSPSVQTLEAIADVLGCPFSELLGEPAQIEYRALAEWPEALQEVIAERGGFVRPAEQAFLAERLRTLSPGEEPGRARAGLPQVKDDPRYWRDQLRVFRDNRQWRLIDALVTRGGWLSPSSVVGLELIVQEMIGPAPELERVAENNTEQAPGEDPDGPGDDAEQEAASRLGVSRYDVAVMARRLWERSFTDERDARVAQKAGPEASAPTVRTYRGHVRRELLGELRAEIERVKAEWDRAALRLWDRSWDDELERRVEERGDPGDRERAAIWRELAKELKAAMDEEED